MSKVLILVSSDDAGDEGDYNGCVLGSVVEVIDCDNLTEEYATEYVIGRFCEGEKEDYDNGELELEVMTPHPHDSEYAMMVDAGGGEYYHFMNI